MMKLIKYIILLVPLIALICNMVISIREEHILGIFSFRNLYLIILITCIVSKNKYLAILSFLISIIFWYYFISTSSNVSYGNNPIINYTYSLFGVFEISSRIIKRIVVASPFVVNLFITVLSVINIINNFIKKID
ncbi:hypothetical protein [Chryseobacterium sp. SL1]|uniref:hypothetical protein n=1 Tax=Chryseobacterium sp. SL1 TaxID=2995159 RepID=UPI00227BD53E|nr:hypothetical protein [Chryseobacterium sp. SL1]